MFRCSPEAFAKCHTRIGKRLTRKRFGKLLMRKGIRRNDANEIAVKARGTGLSYAEYLRQWEEAKYTGTSSMPYHYSALNMKIDWSVVDDSNSLQREVPDE